MGTAIPQTSPFMETAALDVETDVAKIAHQPDSEVLPLIETVQAKNQRLHIELGNCASEKELLKQELVELRSQLETERADREKIEAQLSEKEQNSSPAATLSEKLAPDAATTLSQLRAKRKKSPVSLADIEAILEIIEES
jgi:DNA repair exonuclease SbcCD ATPase subunit